jgi:hypothetical protein
MIDALDASEWIIDAGRKGTNGHFHKLENGEFEVLFLGALRPTDKLLFEKRGY